MSFYGRRDPQFFDYGHYCPVCDAELVLDWDGRKLYCEDCYREEVEAEEEDEDAYAMIQDTKRFWVRLRDGYRPEATYKA